MYEKRGTIFKKSKMNLFSECFPYECLRGVDWNWFTAENNFIIIKIFV